MRFPLFLLEGAADFVVAVFVFLEGGEVMFFLVFDVVSHLNFVTVTQNLWLEIRAHNQILMEVVVLVLGLAKDR